MKPAILDLQLVQQLAESFPNDGWHTIHSRDFIDDRGERIRSDWSSVRHLDGVGGVYAILLPAVWFAPRRTLPLHAPHKHEGEKIPYEFSLPDFTDDGYGVTYVGRTTRFPGRWEGHFTVGKRKDGGQVKFGLLDCMVAPDIETALRQLRENARIVYTELSGPDQCANRDILEMSLCSRLAPPFNIKSER